jgi:hypothetical protein
MTVLNSIKRFAPLQTHNVTLPDHLLVVVTHDDLLSKTHTFGYDGEQFFGCAFIQGRRLQFTTAMPLSKMIKISKIDRAKAGGTVKEVREAANRPRVAGHSKALREYLLTTACRDEKFVLPAFAFNFGDESTTPEEVPEAVLIIYAREGDISTNGWPALFQLPSATKLDTTDGAHRGDETNKILNDLTLSESERTNLRSNAVSVTVIFERKRVDAHQDFADCAKAKPITGSLISTFDVRDIKNARAVELVSAMPFLLHYVDATAANVNLSTGSVKIWSMSAVRGFVTHVLDHWPPADGSGQQIEATLTEKLQGAETFLGTVIKHLPQLNTLDQARLEQEERRRTNVPPKTPMVREEVPATFRNKRGGDVILRGVGMSMLARAFVYCKEHGWPYEKMAEKLSEIDWHLLDCERDKLPNPETDDGRKTFADEVRKHTNPIWSSLVVVGESRYKIGSSNDEANAAWARIVAKIDPAVAIAAE